MRNIAVGMFTMWFFLIMSWVFLIQALLVYELPAAWPFYIGQGVCGAIGVSIGALTHKRGEY